jgi:ribulose-phosphate 3-epimerase
VDIVLIMTVNPGFGGQVFIDSQLRKIEAAAERIAKSGRTIALKVDGGITPETARVAVSAGANVLVAGTAVFSGGPARYAANIAALRG